MTIQLPHDIIEPAPIGWWPLAPGWWALLVLALLALALLTRWYWRRWRRLAALRHALREHKQIAAHWQQQRDGRAATAALSALLKRVARHYHPTEPVASLTGAAWQAFLSRTGAGAFDAESAAALTRFYQAADTAEAAPPIAACERWLLAQRKPAKPSRMATPISGVPDHV